MDTKLKKFNDNMLVRTLVFIMCVMLFTASIISGVAAVLTVQATGTNANLNDIWGPRSYLESAELQQEFRDQALRLSDIIASYKSEENIKSGSFINDVNSQFSDAIAELYYNDGYYTGYESIVANPIDSSVLDEIYSENGNDNYEEKTGLDNPKIKAAFLEANKEQIEKIKQIIIKDRLRTFNNLKEKINSVNGMTYFASNGKDIFSNVGNEPSKSDFQKKQAYMIYENGQLVKTPESSNNTSSWVRLIDNDIEDQLYNQYNDDLKVYIAFDNDFISEKQAMYENMDGVETLIYYSAGSLLGAAILLLYLLITTGRRNEDGKIKLYGLDRIWTELQLCIIGGALFAGAMIINWFWYYTLGQLSSVEGWILASACFVIATIGLWFILSIVRLIKARLLIKNSLLYKLWNMVIHRCCGSIWESIKRIFNGTGLTKKIVLVALVICLASATVFLAPVVFLVIVVFAPKWVKKFEEIQKGVEEVKNGNLSYKIPVEGVSELDKLAESINSISESSNIAVQNELKNQRLKTDLISNVSHDLKTPLTSMVTYIDLLKSEGLDSINAKEYLRILDEKTERLRHLTEDLFEAAKASSGAMPVNLEKVELLSLVNQGLGEMDNKIEASGLEFIINADSEKYYVLADGQLLWRVVENLLVNVLKYAMEKSRVYIDIKEIGGKKEGVSGVITLEMKNISKNPLNISADELLERFKRGDESRTTEGSGLGLAIAKDLIKLQNGWFEVFVDGDLFKVQVMLTKYKEEQQEK
ncbi:MAG: histidine kinase dimerization/phospho-acceptor domain-containing protein [Aminipila sp.]